LHHHCPKGRLIVFMGAEGVGKSTQIDLLRSWLLKSNYRIKVVDIRGNLLFAYLLWKFLMLAGRYSDYLRPDGTMTRGPDKVILAKVCKLWFILQLVSVLPLILFKVRLPLLLGYVVIAERYIVDTLSDILRLAQNLGISNSWSVSASFILSRFLRGDAFFIFLTAEYSELTSRYRKRLTPTEWREYIERRNQYYKIVVQRLGIEYFFIDTTRETTTMTFARILTRLNDWWRSE